MNEIYVLSNGNNSIEFMINNVGEVLGVFLTFEEAVEASKNELYKYFPFLYIEKMRLGNPDPKSNILNSWEGEVMIDGTRTFTDQY